MSVGEMGEAELPYSQGSEEEVYSIEEIDGGNRKHEEY